MIAGLIMGAMKLAGSWIENKDKKEELATEVMTRVLGIADKAIAQQTVPWVDALVKLIAAGYTFLRPLGAACMTAVGIYFHYKNIEIDGVVHAMLDGAFPAWGAAREVDKKRKHKRQKRTDVRDLF